MAERPRAPDEPARRPFFGWAQPRDAALLTDFYEITMLQAYWRNGMFEEASFDLFVRHLPPTRRFLAVAGIEPALAYLGSLRFPAEGLDYLRSLGRFDSEFVSWLGGMRFTGEAWAMPEGEIAFAGEPLIRISAPLPEAQLAETFLLNTILFQTAIASKAARVTIAAAGHVWVDFSPRRDHGTDAALKVARAAYIGGAGGTSNVLAARLFGLPVSGTMAHSFVMAFESEREAFEAFAREFPGDAVLLVDTYDVEAGIRNACETGRRLAENGRTLAAVRIDSGDLGECARLARRLLDEAGLSETKVFASGDLNEHRIAQLVASGSPIDGFGVGTELGTSFDAPALGGVYKLVEYAGSGRAKRSAEKATLPGKKQVYRSDGFRDVIELADDPSPGGEPLLRRVMRRGRVCVEMESLDAARDRCAARLAALPDDARSLLPGPSPEPAIGPALHAASSVRT